MGSCDDQHQFFSSVMNNMIDQYLPLRQIQVDSNDKPWITPEVKDLISKRQAALAMGNGLTFRFYRNKINAPIIIGNRVINTVSEAKLLGMVILNGTAADYVYKEAAKRLYGLRLLKRNALPADVLLSVYCMYI